MTLKIFGGALIVLSCGCFGFLMAGSFYMERRALRQWISALDYMQCELQYHMSSLPELCRQASSLCTGRLKELFCHLASELDLQLEPDVNGCMCRAISNVNGLPAQVRDAAEELGRTLGRFDSTGQIQQLEEARQSGRNRLVNLEMDADQRIHSYQTLGICAGAALAILLI